MAVTSRYTLRPSLPKQRPLTQAETVRDISTSPLVTQPCSLDSSMNFFQDWLQVVEGAQNGATKQLRSRLMQEDADLTAEERLQIETKLEEIANSGKW